MSLKEKAKTLVQIIRENCIELYISRCKFCIGECQFEGTKSFAGNWVRLEDAQKEIDHLSEQRNIEYTIRNSLQRERLELKQKLQQLVKEIPSCVDCEYCLGDEEGNSHCGLDEQQHLDSVSCLKDKFLNTLKEKFEELLTG